LLAPLDQFGHTASAFAAKLRISLAAELRLARLAAFAAKLRVPARTELRLTRFAALSPQLRVPLGTELSLTGLPTAPADLPIEGRAVLARRRRPAAFTGLLDGELSAWIHLSNVGGQPSLACRSRSHTEPQNARAKVGTA